MSIRKVVVALGLGLLIPASAFAAFSFSDSNLNGNFVVSANGFAADDNGDVGGLGITGLISLDGSGNVNGGTLTLTYNDSATEQFSCEVTSSDIDTGSSSYSVNGDGTGAIELVFNGNDCFDFDDELSIGYTLARATGGTGRVIIPGGDDAGFPDDILHIFTTVLGSPFAFETLETFALTGGIFKQ